MNKYIDYYFDILINSTSIEEIREILPSINLGKTNDILDILIGKIDEEIRVAEELGDFEYLDYLKKVIELLNSSKVVEDKVDEVSFADENIIIFSESFLKSLRRLDDSFYYGECMSAIESLRSKQWMAGNLSNGEKYKRLHGEAAGLSEVKEKKIRLMHMPINGDFWYVCDILKKDGNNPKQHRIILNGLAHYCKIDVEAIREKFTKDDGQLDYDGLILYAKENNQIVMEELMRFGGKKR